jgi:hypothetical protein
VRVRTAALAGDGVHALDVLRSELEEHAVRDRDTLVLADAGPEVPVELVVGGVDHRAGGCEQCDLVLGLDLPDLLHQRLAVHHLDPFGLERAEHGQLDYVDADGLAQQAVRLELGADLRCNRLRSALDGAAQRRDPGA